MMVSVPFVRFGIALLLVGGISQPGHADVVEVTAGVRVFPEARRTLHAKRGRVFRKARFTVLERAKGPGCKGDWLRIAERGWICSRRARATTLAPTRKPVLEASRRTRLPFVYIVTRRATVYRSLKDAIAGRGGRVGPGVGGFPLRRVVRRGGNSYYKIRPGWVRKGRRARAASPARARGVKLTRGRDSQIGFVYTRRAYLRDRKGKRKRRLRRHQVLRQLGASLRTRRGVLVALGEGDFVRRRDIRVVRFRARPEGVGPSEPWIDVDQREQVLVAHRGDVPVYAALISSSGSTPRGTFRIYKKSLVQRLKSAFGGPKSWDLHTPWVQYFAKHFAVHATYWHRSFGKRRSHGCVNMAPADAEWIWAFTSPDLPNGWIKVRDPERNSGTLIRIR